MNSQIVTGKMGDLRDIIENLSSEKAGKRRFQDLHLEVMNDVHFMSDILPSKHCKIPYILASRYIDDDELASDGDASPVTANAETSLMRPKLSVQSALDGSPLQIVSYIHMQFGDSPVRHPSTSSAVLSNSGRTLIPVSADEARELVGMYSNIIQEIWECDGQQSALPLWVLCEADEPEGLACLSRQVCHHQDVEQITTFVVTVEEFVDKKRLPKPLMVQKEHCWRSGSEQFSTSCFAQYDITGIVDNDESHCDQAKGFLTLKLYWKDLKPLLSQPPLTARAYVDVMIGAGEDISAASGSSRELATLKALVCGLKVGQIQWCDEQSEVSLINKVKDLIDDLKRGESWGNSKDLNEEEDQPRSQILAERKDLDFTEQLWLILKDSCSYEEVVACLQHVLSCLHQGQLQPMVRKSNTSQLASLVRDSYYNKMAMPSLQGLKPIEILVEIGVEKLARDCMESLIGKDLVTLNDLGFFVKSTAIDIHERFERLERLHCAVELAVILDQFFKLPMTTIGIGTRQALKHLETHSVNKYHVFTTKVQTNDIARFTESYHASVWELILESQTEQGDITSVYLLTTKPSLSHITCNQPADQNEEQQTYFLTTVKQTVLQL